MFLRIPSPQGGPSHRDWLSLVANYSQEVGFVVLGFVPGYRLNISIYKRSLWHIYGLGYLSISHSDQRLRQGFVRLGRCRK